MGYTNVTGGLFDFPMYESSGKKIRLIELFGGVGTQAMALRDIGADFEHHRLVEFDKNAIASYNAIHGTSFVPSDIKDIRGTDLGIVDKENYRYLVTYSFPCQDLSLAGGRLGMAKGDKTRSGLLWEVERILDELSADALPDILVMENVPQVHSDANKKDFDSWCDFLSEKGYYNFWRDLNARDFGIPQNRERCFMVSILSKDALTFDFPKPFPLVTSVADYLETDVDKKFYVRFNRLAEVMENLDFGEVEGNIPVVVSGIRGESINSSITRTSVGATILSSEYKGLENFGNNAVIVSMRGRSEGWEKDLLFLKGGMEYRLRRLTPRENWRLMGFSDADFDRASSVNSNTQLYRQAGNAIVKQVLMEILRKII